MSKKRKETTESTATEHAAATSAAAQPKKASTRSRRKQAVPAAADAQADGSAPAPGATPRRAIFIDVENTTAERSLLEVLRTLEIDPQRQQVELTAIGNWRAVPPVLARRLASLGAKLVHSAPARGVRDWSDLWIATAAGCWLGQARPGDVLEVISNDRAFDAIGDLAAARGVTFRRIPHTPRPNTTAAAANEDTSAAALQPSARRKRPSTTAAAPALSAAEVGQAAPAEQIIATIAHLTKGEPGRWVNLDVLERALKEQGFVRPPGSPRLVTRLRALRQVEVDAHGRARIRLPDEMESAAPAATSE